MSFKRRYWVLCIAFFTLALGSGCTGCKKKTTTPKDGGADAGVQKKPKEPSTLDKVWGAQEKWLRASWLDQVARNSKVLDAYMSAGTEVNDDLQVLRYNKIEDVRDWRDEPSDLKPAQRAFRLRMFLRLAHFHQLNAKMVLELAERYYAAYVTRAMKIKSSKKLKLMRFHWARALCLRGKKKKALTQLQLSLKELPPERHTRVKLWSALCAASGPDKGTLAKLDLTRDPVGLQDFALAQAYFKIQGSQKLALTNRIGNFFQRVLAKQVPASIPRVLYREWRKPLEIETITEKEISSSIKYFDPLFSWMLQKHFTIQATKLLAALSKKDPYVPFYAAKIALLNDDAKGAKAGFEKLLKNPPKKNDLKYLLFSRYASSEAILDEATFRLALLNKDKDKKGSIAAFKKLKAKGYYPALSYGALGLLTLSQDKDENLKILRDGVGLAARGLDVRIHSFFEEYVPGSATPKKAHKKPTSNKKNPKKTKGAKKGKPAKAKKASKKKVKKTSKKKTSFMGAKIILKLNMYRSILRPFFFLASEGALQAKKPYRGAIWMELLHIKKPPYQIGGLNGTTQMVWTGYLYFQARRFSQSNRFFAKNRKVFPSIVPIWKLLGDFRIVLGIDSVGSGGGPK